MAMMVHSKRALVSTLLLSTLLAAGIAGAASFDNDAKSDLAVFRSSTSMWYVKQSSDGAVKAERWGDPTDNVVAADYDGDGKTDVAVWRSGTGMWYVKQSSNGAVIAERWGDPTDIPVPGDYDGDGKTDVAVWRPSTGTWYVKQSSDGAVKVERWGDPTDVPVPEDYDRDGKTDFAVWRPSTGMWYVKQSSDGAVKAERWGDPTDVPVPGDYDGDGKADFAVWRPSTSMWYVKQSSDGAVKAERWGDSTDRPMPADYDGDGKTDFAVWRSSTSMWYVKRSSDGGVIAERWGDSTDTPIFALRSPTRPSGFAGPIDMRNYFPLRLGDMSIRSDNSMRITLRNERLSDVSIPVTAERNLQQSGYYSEDLYGFDSSDNSMKQYGYYEVSPYNGNSAKVLYRFVPPRVVGKASMMVGDNLSTTYAIVNTNTGDNVTATFAVTLAAIEAIVTPAGTFDNCVRYDGGDQYGSWSVWLCPNIGMTKEANPGGSNAPVYIHLADNTTYGTPPGRTVADLSGMYDADVVQQNPGGTRWEKNLFSINHDTANDNMAIVRYRPNGNQSPRTGTFNGSAFTIVGTGGGAGPQTFQGVFSPDGRNMAGQWWYDNTSSQKYPISASLVSPPGRANGDEDVNLTQDNTYLRYAYNYPVAYNGLFDAIRRDDFSGVDNGASLVGQSWWMRGPDGLYELGQDNTAFLTPMLLLPDRYKLGTPYTYYDLGGGNSRAIWVDQVMATAGGLVVPLGNFPLAQRMVIQDNVGGFVSSQYLWFAPGVPTFVKSMGGGKTDQLVSHRVNGATFGNRPSTTPFPVLAGAYNFGNHINLQDASDGTKSYFLQIGIKNRDMTQVTNPAAIQDVRIYAWPSMAEIPFKAGSPFLWFANFDNDPDGTGGQPPNPNNPSEIEGFLDVPAGSLAPGVYTAAVTDNTGQMQTAWFYFDTPTETGKIDNSATMYYTVNGDNSVTFHWATPAPAPDNSRNVLKLFVRSAIDANGDGLDDVLFMSSPQGTATSYIMPKSSADKLKGVPLLYWYVQIREQAAYVVNPDMTTSSYFTYRNSGQTQPFSLP